MNSSRERASYERTSSKAKWSNYDFTIYYNPEDMDIVMKLNFTNIKKSTWYNYFAIFYDRVSKECLDFFSTYLLILSKSELLNLYPFFIKAQKYFIAERKYLFLLLYPEMDNLFPTSDSFRDRQKKGELNLLSKQALDDFNTRIMFILIRLFKFSSNMFYNFGVFLRQTKTGFLTFHEIALFIKLIRFKFKELFNKMEEWPCPSNFRSILVNLNSCYWRYYEGCVKRDLESMGGLAQYIGVLDEIVNRGLKGLRV